MNQFMDKNFLLSTRTAQELFHRIAAQLPVYDYHCHLDAREICEDKHFQNITELWLGGDHYKWRLMRAMGIKEEYITGGASDYDKFLAYCRAVQYAAGNPLYHWSHLELRRYFGVEEILTEKNAPMIWEKVNRKINREDFSARGLIRQSNVELIGTTDDPADDLKWHKALREDESFATRVVPTFRPDSALQIAKPEFAGYIQKLSAAAGVPVHSFASLAEALAKRMDFFAEAGCRISDHSLPSIPLAVCSEEKADAALKKALAGGSLTEEEAGVYQLMLLWALGREYAKRGWVMQLHLAALRNNSSRMFAQLGADAGFDSIGDPNIADGLSRYMDMLDMDDCLPKMVLYSLNPKDADVLAAMAGNFQSGGIKGKIQFGSAWWFNDHIDGMTRQMKTLANIGVLDSFVGMLTDSRSFLSYPRHEYFRRILCRIVGEWVEEGLFPDDEGLLEHIIAGVSYRNAAEYFNM